MKVTANIGVAQPAPTCPGGVVGASRVRIVPSLLPGATAQRARTGGLIASVPGRGLEWRRDRCYCAGCRPTRRVDQGVCALPFASTMVPNAASNRVGARRLHTVKARLRESRMKQPLKSFVPGAGSQVPPAR